MRFNSIASRLAAAERVSRKRALSVSPYSDLDLAALRNSPTFLNSMNGAPGAVGGSPNSSLSLGLHPSTSHLHQLQAHLLRSAGGNPGNYLNPQNSLLHHHAAAAVLHSQSSSYFPLFGQATMTTTNATNTATATTTTASKTTKETIKTEPASSNVVSSTVTEDEEPSSVNRERRQSDHEPGYVKAAASSSTKDMDMVKEEPETEEDFVETHCHWVNCDRDCGTQEQLVKVK